MTVLWASDLLECLEHAFDVLHGQHGGKHQLNHQSQMEPQHRQRLLLGVGNVMRAEKKGGNRES